MKSFGIEIAYTNLAQTGTMQLRKIARAMHVTNVNARQREELILAIMARHNECLRDRGTEYLNGQQLMLF